MPGSRKPLRRGVGFVGIMLTLVLVFALIASVELTRTLIAAQQIDTQVSDITGSVKGANAHLNTGCDVGATCSDALPVLSQTEVIVAHINDAAQPLTGELTKVIGSVNGINASATQILASATSINGTVHAINGAAGSINSSVNSIGAQLAGIDTAALAIRGSNPAGSTFQSGVAGINNRADAVISLVNAIKGDTGTINSEAGGILTQARAISCDKVAGLVGPLSSTC